MSNEMPFPNLEGEEAPSIESLFDQAVEQGVENIEEEQKLESVKVQKEADESPELARKIDLLMNDFAKFKKDNDVFINKIESTMAELMKANTLDLQKKVEKQIRAIAQVQDAVVSRMAEVQSAGTQQQIELLKTELLEMREQIELFIVSERFLEENLEDAIDQAVGKNIEKISSDLEKSYQTADRIGETIQKLGKAVKRTMDEINWRVGAKSKIERNLLYIMGGASIANLVFTWSNFSEKLAMVKIDEYMGFITVFCIGLPMLLDVIFWRKK